MLRALSVAFMRATAEGIVRFFQANSWDLGVTARFLRTPREKRGLLKLQPAAVMHQNVRNNAVFTTKLASDTYDTVNSASTPNDKRTKISALGAPGAYECECTNPETCKTQLPWACQ